MIETTQLSSYAYCQHRRVSFSGNKSRLDRDLRRWFTRLKKKFILSGSPSRPFWSMASYGNSMLQQIWHVQDTFKLLLKDHTVTLNLQSLIARALMDTPAPSTLVLHVHDTLWLHIFATTCQKSCWLIFCWQLSNWQANGNCYKNKILKY